MTSHPTRHESFVPQPTQMNPENRLTWQLQQAAYDQNECTVCLQPIQALGQVAVFIKDQRRLCQHYVCPGCTTTLRGQCPLCRRPFDGCQVVPIHDPQRVFELLDLDQSGQLDQNEVTKGLEMMLPVRHSDMSSYVQRNWAQWDRDRNGVLCRQEFLSVLQMAQRDFRVGSGADSISNTSSSPATQGALPDLLRQPAEFFQYWDTDRSGSLSHGELLRAFIHAFALTGNSTAIRDLQESIGALFVVFDDNNSGNFEFQEFLELVQGNRVELNEMIQRAKSNILSQPQGSSAPVSVNFSQNQPSNHGGPPPYQPYSQQPPQPRPSASSQSGPVPMQQHMLPQYYGQPYSNPGYPTQPPIYGMPYTAAAQQGYPPQSGYPPPQGYPPAQAYPLSGAPYPPPQQSAMGQPYPNSSGPFPYAGYPAGYVNQRPPPPR